MTTISILSGEWEIAFEDETVGANAVAGLKMVRHISGTSVITSNVLYSAVADAMDEHAAMDFDNPMLPVTPEAYTVENGYFVPNTSTQFLEGGAISTVSQTAAVRSILHNNSTPFVSGDIGRQVVGGTTTDTGTLVDFETLPDGTTVIWIRPDDPLVDLFDNAAETLSTVADGGTGVATSTAISTTGEQLWSNIQVIGGIASNSEVYVVQDKTKLTQWWATDPTLALGIIDILVRVRRDGTLIANGEVEVFSRRYTALYDNFALDVSAGGRAALPLATADDINNTTGYRAAVWSGGTGSAMSVGDLLTNTTQVGAFALVTAVVDSGATGTFEYYLVGDLNDFVTTNTFTGTRNGTINGAPTANLTGPTDAAAGQGGSVTIALGTTTFDADGDGTAEPYSMTIDAQGDVSLAEVYERIKYATRRGAPNTDLFGAGVNMPGEQFRGAQVQVQYDTPVGTFTEGDDVFETAGTFTCINLATNTTDTYVMLTDPFDLTTLADTDTLEDEAGDTVDVAVTITSITPVKASPFGTSTGAQIFGSRGVLFLNPAAGDEQSYIGTDDNGVLRTPPNTVAVEVTGLETLDVVFVADDDGTAGIIDKDRFGGMAVASISDAVITAGTTIDNDVPQAGFIRVLDTSAQEEHCYRYSSRSSTVFTLVTDAGTATGGTATTLIDAGATFQTTGIQPGDRCRSTTESANAIVVSVDSETQLTTTAITDWNGDGYEIGEINVAYTTSDDIFAPIIDRATIAGDSGSISNSLVQSTSFGVVVNVRQGKVILPFTQNATVGSTGLSLAAIRSLDTIAT
tara:strand:- start:45184 stop:47586 length:2403 start_codon:yes stop_codon:yes gene_type:complete